MDGSEQQIAASEARGKRGRGKPFVKGDARINRHGVTRESAALAKLVRDTAADVLFNPSPRQPDKRRLVCILETLSDKAEGGDVRAAEVLLERIGGKPTQPIEADVTERGRITFEWSFEPPSWAPKHVLDEYEAKRREKYGNAPTESETKNAQSEAQPQVTEFEVEPSKPRESMPPPPTLSPYSPVDLAHHDDTLLAYAKCARN